MSATPEATAFAEGFAAAWSAPTPERLVALLSDDVVLRQPLAPTTRGKAAAIEALGRVLALVPDLHAEVHRHWGDSEQVVIEFDLIGTLSGREVRWHVVDVFELEDGLGRERRSYFDPSPLIRAIVTRPGAWLPYLRSGLWRR